MAVLVDFSNIIVSNVSVMWKHRKEPEYIEFLSSLYTPADLKKGRVIVKDTIRRMILASIGKYVRKYVKGWGDIIICMDTKVNNKYWRSIPDMGGFVEYKGNRKKPQTKDDPIPWDTLMPIAMEVVGEIIENFPYRFIRVDFAEGDDCIAVLAKIFNDAGEKVMIVSEDKDLVQMQIYENVDQYRPITDKKHTFGKKEAQHQFIELVLAGDRGDGIPNVRSPLNIFVDVDENGKQKGKQPPISKKLKERAKDLNGDFAAAIKEILPEKEHEFALQRVEENKKWIGLVDTTPKSLVTQIIEQSQRHPIGDNDKMTTYLASHKQCEELYKNYEHFAVVETQSPFAKRRAKMDAGLIEEPAGLDDFFDTL